MVHYTRGTLEQKCSESKLAKCLKSEWMKLENKVNNKKCLLCISFKNYSKRSFFAFLLKWQSYVSLSLVIIICNYEKFVWQFLHVRSYHSSIKATVAWWSQKSQNFYEVTSNVTIICQNDNLTLSLTWLDLIVSK